MHRAHEEEVCDATGDAGVGAGDFRGGALVSAYVVSDEHIRALVEAGLWFGEQERFRWYWRGERRAVSADNASAVGSMLLAENVRSVNYRYGEEREAVVYAHQVAPVRNDTHAQVLKAIACYEYQACETGAWKDTEAAAYCEMLRQAVIRDLPGYDAAAWEITEPPARASCDEVVTIAMGARSGQ